MEGLFSVVRTNEYLGSGYHQGRPQGSVRVEEHPVLRSESVVSTYEWLGYDFVLGVWEIVSMDIDDMLAFCIAL